MKSTCRNSRKSTPRSGAAAVEFAVCLPVVVLLFIGSIECCNMIFLDQSLSVASYEGARVAIQFQATNDATMARCTQIVNSRQIKEASLAIEPADVSAVPAGTPITITVSAPCDANSMINLGFSSGRTLAAQITMVKE